MDWKIIRENIDCIDWLLCFKQNWLPLPWSLDFFRSCQSLMLWKNHFYLNDGVWRSYRSDLLRTKTHIVVLIKIFYFNIKYIGSKSVHCYANSKRNIWYLVDGDNRTNLKSNKLNQFIPRTESCLYSHHALLPEVLQTLNEMPGSLSSTNPSIMSNLLIKQYRVLVTIINNEVQTSNHLCSVAFRIGSVFSMLGIKLHSIEKIYV